MLSRSIFFNYLNLRMKQMECSNLFKKVTLSGKLRDLCTEKYYNNDEFIFFYIMLYSICANYILLVNILERIVFETKEMPCS